MDTAITNLRPGQFGKTRLLIAGLIVCVAVGLGTRQGAACELCSADDLLTLSLQDLYNLDVFKMNALGAHTHPKGEIMFGYQFMFMNMEGIRDGTREVTPAEVFAANPQFTVAHIKMEMEEHMFDVMWAPTDRLTLMAMLPFRQMSMLHVTSTNTTFTQHASGIGDLEIMGMFTVLGDIKKGGHRLLLDAGMSFPTGSIDVQDHRLGDPANPKQKLEYPMQLGSGTFDLRPGLTYLGDSDKWAWGAQALATIRLGKNSSDYAFGNKYRATGWVAYGLTDWLAPYARLEGTAWGNVTGSDPAYGAVPTSAEASPNLQAGERVNMVLGTTIYAPRGFLKGNRITIEGGLPIHERLTGPQLGLGYMINVGWTYGF